MDGWIPMFFLASASREDRKPTAEAMLPGLLPVAASQRAAVTAVAAVQQVQAAKQQQQLAVADSISAVQTVLARPDGARTLTDQDLAGLPTLKTILDRPGVGVELRARIDGVGLGAESDTQGLASEATKLLFTALNLPKGTKLAPGDLQGTRLGQLILNDPILSKQVVQPGVVAAAVP
jgi:hypothetical protein